MDDHVEEAADEQADDRGEGGRDDRIEEERHG
jgi:hypothetical protein